MRFFRIFKYKRQLKKFAKRNQIAEASEYIYKLELTQKETNKLKQIITCFFDENEAADLKLLLEVKE